MHSIMEKTSWPARLEERESDACLLMNFAFLQAEETFNPTNDNTKANEQPRSSKMLVTEKYIFVSQSQPRSSP